MDDTKLSTMFEQFVEHDRRPEGPGSQNEAHVSHCLYTDVRVQPAAARVDREAAVSKQGGA